MYRIYRSGAIKILLAAALLLFLLSRSDTAWAASPLMTVTALDYGSSKVKSGDAVLLSSGGEYLLMDTHNYDPNEKVIRYLKSHKIKKLSLYLSHWHQDHFYYLWKIMDDPYFEVTKLYLPSTKWTRTCARAKYARYPWYKDARRCWRGNPSQGLYGAKQVIAKAKEKDVPVKYLKKGSTFRIGKTSARVLWCGCDCKVTSKGFFPYINDRSLVTRFSAGGISYLTAGDISEDVFVHMQKEGIRLRADLYKLSHHGHADNSYTIRKIRPTYAFYCDSAEKRGKMNMTPERKAVAKYTKLYSVRKSGNITFKIYGKDARVPIRVKTQRGK